MLSTSQASKSQRKSSISTNSGSKRDPHPDSECSEDGFQSASAWSHLVLDKYRLRYRVKELGWSACQCSDSTHAKVSTFTTLALLRNYHAGNLVLRKHCWRIFGLAQLYSHGRCGRSHGLGPGPGGSKFVSYAKHKLVPCQLHERRWAASVWTRGPWNSSSHKGAPKNRARGGHCWCNLGLLIHNPWVKSGCFELHGCEWEHSQAPLTDRARKNPGQRPCCTHAGQPSRLRRPCLFSSSHSSRNSLDLCWVNRPPQATHAKGSRLVHRQCHGWVCRNGSSLPICRNNQKSDLAHAAWCKLGA